MRKKAVFWDIDGTLVDSEPLHLLALQHTCSRYGVDISDLPDDHFIGVSLHGVWEALHARFPAQLNRNTWADSLNAIYAQGAGQLRLKPNAQSIIYALALLGVRQAAVPNSNRVVVNVNLDALGIRAFLEFSLSLDDLPEGMPSPLPYLKALERMKILAEAALAVEDSSTGVASARAAGLAVVGFGDPDLGADYHVDDLIDVITYLKAG